MQMNWTDLLGQKQINLADVLIQRHVRQGHGSRNAVIYRDRRYSYAELADSIARTANVLRQRGLARGDAVLLAASDSPAFVITFFAILASGAVAVLANPLLAPEDMQHMAHHAGVRIAILHQGIGDKADFLRTHSFDVILCGDAHTQIAELEHLTLASSPIFEIVSTTADDMAYVLFSSGTTGKPKGIPRRHRDILHCARAYAEVVHFNPDDLVIAVPKLTFGYALGGSLLFSLLAGACVVLFPERTSAAAMAGHIAHYHPSILLGTPRIIAELLKNHEIAPLRGLRAAISAGETLPPSVLGQWQDVLDMPLLDGFGSTEAGHIFLSNSAQAIVPGSCGQCLPGFEVKLVDEHGATVADGEAGRLCIKGPSVASAYLNDVERSGAAFDGEWHYSQDLFIYRDQAYTYVGRGDDMIKKGCGEWISPYEVENTLLKLPSVLECAVVGSHNANGVIALKAYVVGNVGAQIGDALAQALIASTRQRWPDFPHKHLDQVEFLEELPRNTAGKVQRHLLRQQTLSEFSYDC